MILNLFRIDHLLFCIPLYLTPIHFCLSFSSFYLLVVQGKGSQIDGRRELVEVERRLCGGKSGCKSGGKLGKGKGSRRLSSGKGKGGYSGDGCNAIDIIEEANEIIQEKCKPCECSHAPSSEPSSEPSSQPSKVPTSPPVTTPAQVAPEAGVVIEARQTCVKSHESYGFDMYPDLAGWCTEVTANTKLNCRDGNFNLGWRDPGERGFDNLKLVCPGQPTITFGEFCPTDQQVQIGCKLYFYADNSHTYEGFNICTPPGIAGLAPCRPSAGVMRSNELRSGGICFVSHPEYNDFEARNGEGQPYPKLYGWSIPVTYSGTANARNFDIRGRGTGQFLSLIRDGKIIQQWQGDMGPQGIETRVGDVWQFFADDSSSCGTDPATGVQKCRKGFEICLD